MIVWDRWRDRKALRDFERMQERDLNSDDLEQQGRWAELAAELAAIARGYARLTRVVDYHTSVLSARVRRCEALVRAGDGARAKAEAAHLTELLTELEGPDGPTLRMLSERMALAERETTGR